MSRKQCFTLGLGVQSCGDRRRLESAFSSAVSGIDYVAAREYLIEIGSTMAGPGIPPLMSSGRMLKNHTGAIYLCRADVRCRSEQLSRVRMGGPEDNVVSDAVLPDLRRARARRLGPRSS